VTADVVLKNIVNTVGVLERTMAGSGGQCPQLTSCWDQFQTDVPTALVDDFAAPVQSPDGLSCFESVLSRPRGSAGLNQHHPAALVDDESPIDHDPAASSWNLHLERPEPMKPKVAQPGDVHFQSDPDTPRRRSVIDHLQDRHRQLLCVALRYLNSKLN